MDTITTTTTSTLADDVFERLQFAIVKGDIPPGQKVAEAELCRMFGVSRGPLREALRRLESRGLVVKRPHVGISVVSLTASELIEIYEVREALEGLACRLAAERMTEEQIQDLRNLLVEHEAHVEQQQGMAYYQSEGDFDFHYRIVQAANNKKLNVLLCGELYHLVRMYRGRFSSSVGRPQRALREHHQIVDALENRDAELAELLMRRHIATARENIEKQL